MARKKADNSILQMANDIGVSTATISRVLNGSPNVSGDTREKVMNAVKKIGYKLPRPNPGSRIAVICDYLDEISQSGYIAHILSALIKTIEDRSCYTELYSASAFIRKTETFSPDVKGVIVLCGDQMLVSHLKELKNIPVVVLNNQDIKGYPVVKSNHLQSGRLAAQYLLDNGHKDVGFIAQVLNTAMKTRLKGFIDCFKEAGVEFDESKCEFAEHTPLYAAMKRILDQRPTAIFVADESFALEASYLLKDVFNVKIPEDISIISMENPSVSQFITPPLTSVMQPFNEIASCAVDVIFKHIRPVKGEDLIFDNKLIKRMSVKEL